LLPGVCLIFLQDGYEMQSIWCQENTSQFAMLDFMGFKVSKVFYCSSDVAS